MTRTVRKALPRLLHGDDGAAAIEYALVVVLIAGVILAALSALGSNLDLKLSNLASAMEASQSGSPGGGNNGNGNGNGKGGNGNGNNGNGNGNGGPAP